MIDDLASLYFLVEPMVTLYLASQLAFACLFTGVYLATLRFPIPPKE